ncbi:MAG: DUF4965 domain-containing protein [Clostridiales bacterium]|nr:DUF4965 domain-containing protein [Clostridiales bacterium]
MILRAPAVPLITVDPYFSVWSNTDKLNDGDTVHWTGKPNTICGVVEVDGKDYCFMGKCGADKLTQTAVDITALTTTYTFEGAGISLNACFFTPLFPDNLDIMSRPVSYLELSAKSIDGEAHSLKAKIYASEELCLDTKGQFEVTTETKSFDGINAVKIGSVDQPVLAKDGDDIRIDWGYFYLAAKDAKVGAEKCEETGMTFVSLEKEFTDSALITFAYDDIYSIEYFGDKLKSVWNRDGKTIETAITEAFSDYDELLAKAAAFDDKLVLDSLRAGGEKYSELLQLAFRQVIAAHKAVLDTDGKLLFISKECFSNGCAATVDVSYPSIPMFLIYNPELVLAMMRPIFKYAKSDAWEYDFAPHDVGKYPLLNGQVYGGNELKYQMPVEECGNMLIMTATYSIASGDFSCAEEHFDILKAWTKYLIDNGADPANQRCTDDFAGHFAHNCNLSLKAISGIAGMGIICEKLGKHEEAGAYFDSARKLSINWLLRAQNGDGSYRLVFDCKGTYSMKYNIVWDKLFGTKLIPAEVFDGEAWANRRHFNKYGMPLDNRKAYTKSDWLVWTATLCNSKADFESYIEPLWEAYNTMPSRVPMTDWYDTITSVQTGFQNRTVQGGLFIKLLEYYKTVKVY